MFIPAARIERRAVAYWHRHGLALGFDIEALLDDLDLGPTWAAIEPVGGEDVAAELLRLDHMIIANERLREKFAQYQEMYRFTLAHELGHWELHVQSSDQSDQLLDSVADAHYCSLLDLDGADGPSLVSSQAARNREHQANLFASYLLAPTDQFRSALRTIGCNGWGEVRRLGESVGLSKTATLVRLERDGLGYRDEYGVPRPGVRPAPGQGSFGL